MRTVADVEKKIAELQARGVASDALDPVREVLDRIRATIRPGSDIPETMMKYIQKAFGRMQAAAPSAPSALDAKPAAPTGQPDPRHLTEYAELERILVISPARPRPAPTATAPTQRPTDARPGAAPAIGRTRAAAPQGQPAQGTPAQPMPDAKQRFASALTDCAALLASAREATSTPGPEVAQLVKAFVNADGLTKVAAKGGDFAKAEILLLQAKKKAQEILDAKARDDRARDAAAYPAELAKVKVRLDNARKIATGQPGFEAAKVIGSLVQDLATMEAEFAAQNGADALVVLGRVVPVADRVIAADDLDRKSRREFDQDTARLRPTFLKVDSIVSRTPGPEVSKVAGAFRTSFRTMRVAQAAGDYVSALNTLKSCEKDAGAVLLAHARDEAAACRERQVAAQKAQYDAVAPALEKVRQSYLPAGQADDIAKHHPTRDRAFKDFLTALKTLETLKAGISPKAPVDPAKAKAVMAACDAVDLAARGYIAQYAGQQQLSEDEQKRIDICTEQAKAARHYGMAMVFASVPKPGTPNSDWDLETQVRMTGLMAAFSFEQGYEKAKGTEGVGQSASYWVQSLQVDPTTGGMEATRGRPGDFIFKPTEGEEPPKGMSSPQGAGAVKEALASANSKLFASMTGIDLGVPETTVVAIGAHALDGGKVDGPATIGSVQQFAGKSKEFRQLDAAAKRNLKREDVHKIALLDIMSLSMDRHGGNIMARDDGTLVPIDHGGTLPSRAEFPAVKSRLAGIMSGEVVNVLLTTQAAYEPFAPDMLAAIDLLDPKAMRQGMAAQIDALARVHPDLDPATKVTDGQLDMSERSMIFLKRAAKTLSPAEIQIALSARGCELFDAPDEKALLALADSIIAEQAKMKAAYQEVFFMDEDMRAQMSNWLRTNNYMLPREDGKIDQEEFILRDPENALKLYKAGVSNNGNPAPTVEKWAAPVPKLPDTGPADGGDNDAIKADILRRFPDTPMPTMPKQVPRYLHMQTISVGGKRGMDALDDGIARMEAAPPASMPEALSDLISWQELNKDPKRLAAATKGAGALRLEQIVARAMTAAKNLKAADDHLARIAALAKPVSKDKAETAYIGTLDKRIDLALVNLRDASAKAALMAKKNALKPTVASDVEAAKTKFLALFDEVALALRTEAETLAKARLAHYRGIADRLDLTGAPPEYATPDMVIKAMSDASGNVFTAKSVDAVQEALTKLEDHDKKLQAFPVSPAAAPQPAATPQRPRQAAPTVALPKFDWNARDASRAKAAAVAAGLFTGDTGMSAALDKVLKARKVIDAMKTKGVPADKQIEAYEKGIKIHLAFDSFVAGKLRRLSRDPAWTAYCNQASDAVSDAVTLYRAEIKSLAQPATVATDGGAVGGTRTN